MVLNCISWKSSFLLHFILICIIPSRGFISWKYFLSLVRFLHFFEIVITCLFLSLWDLPAKFDTLWWDHLQPNRCIDTLMQVVRQTNAFVDRHRPWEKRDSSSIVVGVALEALRLFGCLLTPVIPSLSNRLFCGLGIQPGALRCSSWKLSSILRQPFLPRIKV